MSRHSASRVTEAGLVLAALGLLALQAQRAHAGLVSTGSWPVIAGALVVGVLCADFATGIVHWFCDRFFDERTPLLGAALIRPFREHHADPQAMVRHGLLELHGNSAIPIIAALAAVQLLERGPPSVLGASFDAWLFVVAASSMATNQFHMWAHSASAPRIVRWLQAKGVILSPTRHAVHHRHGFDRSYCMTTGLLNPVLDRFDFFGRLERGVRALGSAVR